MKLIDSHCHLIEDEYKDNFQEIIEESKNSLEYIINVGCDLYSSQKALELSKAYDFIFASVGIHPNYSNSYKEEDDIKFLELIKEKRVLAIGECGIDYYRNIVPKDTQNKIFNKQLRWSVEFNKPVIVHGRDAYEEIVSILLLPEYRSIKGVMHSFAGEYKNIEKIIDRFYISISGIVTFKNATNIQNMVKEIPLERLLLETDAPYLTPHPLRGKINRPSYIEYTARKIAEIKNLSYNEIIKITNRNTKELFEIKSSF